MRGGRPFDVVVLGASGTTGRRAAAHLAERAPVLGQRWAAAGRDARRVRDVLAADGTSAPVVLAADVQDPASLAELAAATRVLVNLAGPYTGRAPAVVAACVDAGTSYLDLSGEVPLLRRVVQEHSAAARAAGVAVVQAAGFEALPADVAVLLAAEEAQRRGDRLDDVEAVVAVQPPPGRGGPAHWVSGGTLRSVAAVLAEPGRLHLGDPAALVTDPAAAAAVRARAVGTRAEHPLLPRVLEGRLVGPGSPLALVDPPVVHRTAALRAEEAGDPLVPFRFREGTDLGPARGGSLPLRGALAGALALGQAAGAGLAALPAGVRAPAARWAERVLPGPGTGPSGPSLEEWRWTLRVRARTASGRVLGVTGRGRGHPGYGTTARLVAEAGLVLARDGAAAGRAGCLTPALALGAGALDRLAAAGFVLALDDDPAPA
ncbi:saccharopine dehydrogenase NADP-binding domain-containing protein [Quadrisphaera sp. DSM 44207]|uniref:saccharopine dehydrogenase NADP-binding domain-containing protein n=1 Tax=Quadrisphaera sp. DSM 44207 TaxID=1881057 RepID=UPI0008802AFB|nr:saccharopine dehydrogenase NADP-binding domain-containing protein [Quadrisphaera sp. DSM 44207]SDQ04024.1 Uncharacterized conserved protein [Quadrisphaera sp. DSM 44207]